MARRSEKTFGFHIAVSGVNPNTKYYASDGSMQSLNRAALFLAFDDARVFAKERNIALGDAHNVIVNCECNSRIRDSHTYP